MTELRGQIALLQNTLDSTRRERDGAEERIAALQARVEELEKDMKAIERFGASLPFEVREIIRAALAGKGKGHG